MSHRKKWFQKKELARGWHTEEVWMLTQRWERTQELPSEWKPQQALAATLATATASSCRLSYANAGISACQCNSQNHVRACVRVCEFISTSTEEPHGTGNKSHRAKRQQQKGSNSCTRVQTITDAWSFFIFINIKCYTVFRAGWNAWCQLATSPMRKTPKKKTKRKTYNCALLTEPKAWYSSGL